MRSFEVSVTIYHSAWRDIPEDLNLLGDFSLEYSFHVEEGRLMLCLNCLYVWACGCYMWQVSFQLLNKYNDYREICYESYATGRHGDLLMFNIP
jgi:hypothetical protein